VRSRAADPSRVGAVDGASRLEVYNVYLAVNSDQAGE
jgi:hypothetical protein